MNADLLAMLGGAGVPGSNSSSRNNEGKTLLTFKAGKMTTAIQPNGKYLVTADPRRGQISLIFHTPVRPATTPTLKFEWRDRRTRTVVDDLTILMGEDDISFTQVPTEREGDRIYLLQYANNDDRRFFYWMQDKLVEGGDEQIIRDVNKFVKDRNASATAAGAEEFVVPTGTTATPAAPAPETPAASGNASQQVDALSNILENLGMPPPSNGGDSSGATPATPAPAATPARSGGVLTLADLQGAMAGLATSTPPPPPLPELLSPSLVEESGILSNPDAVARLTELLPENQRTEEFLKENLHSPQVLESVKSLMSVLNSDDGVSSVIANFGLDAGDGGALGENPIKVFLDAVVRSVEKETKKETKEGESGSGGESKDEEMK